MSFICNLSLLILCMWYLSNVDEGFSFFSVFKLSIVILPYVWSVLSMWFKYLELYCYSWLAAYDLYILCEKFDLFFLCILLGSPSLSFGKCCFFLYLSICKSCILCLNCVSFSKMYFICVSLKSFVIFLVYFPLCINLTHLLFRHFGSMFFFVCAVSMSHV
jgi:hypothetical protein